jgi:hypothetical protein
MGLVLFWGWNFDLMIWTDLLDLIFSGCWFRTRLVSLSNLYIETGWEKLKDRRERHRTIQFYKMSNNLTPQYLSNLILQNCGMIHDHNTRHTSRIPPVRTRTSLYASYFIPSSVQLWNQQPENINKWWLRELHWICNLACKICSSRVPI